MAAKLGVSRIRRLEDTFIPILRKCNKTKLLKRIHAQMEKFSLLQSNFLLTRMLEICDQTGEIEYANLLFKRVADPNIFIYNTMIRAYTRNQMYLSTITLYKSMLSCFEILPDRFTYPFVIRSIGGMPDACLAKQIHGHVCKFGLIDDSMVKNSLLYMYVKCDAMAEAHKVFDEMSERDVVSWNSLVSGHMRLGQVRKARAMFDAMQCKNIVSWTVMISGYTKNGCFAEALDVFREMQMTGVLPDWVSLVAVLPACAQLGALELGRWIHFYAERRGFLANTRVCNALIEMYTKCGGVGHALQLFGAMEEPDVVSWSTMIGGLANHGRAREAIELFEEMQKAEVKPNEITFIGLLSACSHAGLLEDGLRYFHSMESGYGMKPGVEHYGCVVDMLGRTGHVDQALELIRGMMMRPGSAIWGSLLSSCRGNRDHLETAVVAAEQLLELEPGDTGNLVLLANIYADLGKWGEVSRLRKVMRGEGMRGRKPGCSLIEVDSVVEEFVAGDDTKACSGEVFRMLGVVAVHQREEMLDDVIVLDH
ncbi:pentatricopeptide repeat-containing protein At2g20540 isoform X1 [Salvia hispanica]|uniref:pentatricopeptide repeat-containing protein At2g20540 isoform X1 n=1 Tax=Salvia hispanica TaxID=49212 RepID=UPI0020093971|nr:pentatricopeptide repeat-containing protein At2g20540 isoform X1 [Salvia hispanica]